MQTTFAGAVAIGAVGLLRRLLTVEQRPPPMPKSSTNRLPRESPKPRLPGMHRITEDGIQGVGSGRRERLRPRTCTSNLPGACIMHTGNSRCKTVQTSLQKLRSSSYWLVKKFTRPEELLCARSDR